MKTMFANRSVVAAALVLTLAPVCAAATAMGEWQVEDASSMCSAGTNQNGASMILLTSKSGASGILIKPADQSAIDIGTSYKVQVSLNGESDHDMNANAIKFGGAKVLILTIPAPRIAAGEANGFGLKVKLNGGTLFDKDMRGRSHDAFAAFVTCSKKFGG